MKLIIGGAFQGKLEYAKNTYGSFDGWIDGVDCALEAIGTCTGIFHFEAYVRRLLKEGVRPEKEWELSVEAFARMVALRIQEENPDLLVVTRELGCGIVPIDPEDRRYRETHGRICTELAKQADEVVRVICGVGMKLKG